MAALHIFDDTLIEHVNALLRLLRSPLSLADALEAGGAEARTTSATIQPGSALFLRE